MPGVLSKGGSWWRAGPALLVAVLALLAAPRAHAVVFFESAWGTQGTADGEFDSLEGVAVAPSGPIYVADTGNDRIQRFSSNGTFLGKWGSFGSAAGQFNRPVGLAVDAGGNVFVADSGNDRVQKFGATGTFLLTIGSGQLNDPGGVAVDATGNLYIADTGNSRIRKFDAAGNFVTGWGTPGAGNGQFSMPLGIALDFAGNVYVTDTGNNRVQKFTSNGAFLAKWGTSGSGNGQFNVPYGIAVNSSGAVFVADNLGNRIQEFDSAGTFVFALGVLGSSPGQFRFPAGLAVDGADRLYAADMGNHRVQRFVASTSAIVAAKDAVPDDPQDFTFAAGGGLNPPSFTLDDDGDDNNGVARSRAFAAEPGSGYSLTESTPPGWDLTSSTCSDGSDPSDINVSAAEIVTCTFTNTKRGQIVVVQQSTPQEPQDFDFTTGGGLNPASFQLDDDGDDTNGLSSTRVITNVVPGDGYSVSQTTPAGWSAAETSCTDGSPVTNVDVAPGETVTCFFKNLSDTAGRIVVVKDAQPDSSQQFSFTLAGGPNPIGFDLDDDGDPEFESPDSRTFIVSPHDGYSVSEQVPPAFHLASATCSDGSPVSNIDVAPTETVTCTFVNQLRGTIRVIKDAQPNDPQDFSFTAGGGLSPASFTLDDDPGSASVPNVRNFSLLAPGAGYSVAETVPPGWEQASATCSDGSDPSNIDVGPGELVECTFTNARQAGIVVVKDAQPEDPQDFSFTAGGGLSPSSFLLDDDGDDNNGQASSRIFANLPSGSGYSVAEDPVPGWDSSATCSDGSPPSNIDLSPAELVTCTFTNRKRGSIALTLDTRPDGPQDFAFTTGGGLTPSSFQLDDDGDSGNELSNSVSFTDVSAGQYSIDQTPVPGWIQEEATCSDGSEATDIDLAPGENITCTVGVSMRSKIVVVKDARPGSQQDFDFTAGGGLTPTSFQLDDDNQEGNGLSSRRTFIVDPGSGYSVQENGPPIGWTASSSCSDGSPATDIDVVAGEVVTCTFLNVGEAYPRPKFASPLRVSLVPGYLQCTTSNRVHGPPLAYPSCNPPGPASTSVTVGTPDANGAAANFSGFVKLKVRGAPGGADDSDIEITGSATDVRCRAGTTTCAMANVADGADYSGKLRIALVLRITDRGAGDIPATVEDISFGAEMTCAGTTSNSIGSACAVTTSADALVPGSVPERERSIWEVGQVEVYDGGSDGDVATPSGDKVFLRQGVLVP